MTAAHAGAVSLRGLGRRRVRVFTGDDLPFRSWSGSEKDSRFAVTQVIPTYVAHEKEGEWQFRQVG